MSAGDIQKAGSLAILAAIVSAIVGLGTLWNDHRYKQTLSLLDGVKAEVERTRAEIAVATQQLEERRHQYATLKEVYSEVLEAMRDTSTSGPQRRELTLVLVEVMTAEPARERMRALLMASGDQAIVAQVNALSAFDASQKVVSEEAFNRARAAPASSARGRLADIDLDVFWCVGSGAVASAQAEIVAAALRRETSGRVRVRELPALVNAHPGYRKHGYSATFNFDHPEFEYAPAVTAIAEEASGVAFEQRASSQLTPWYVSLFLCPTAG
ncbi:MAG: hypothetical protein KF823_12805 [Xanthomonadales bacterium]|nr:hypothetical protein [Xanthomonadales bacterium]